jgi:hypothetical protein
MTAPDNPLLKSALEYAAKGWPVFPCEPQGRKPLTPNGFKDATTDPGPCSLHKGQTCTLRVGPELQTPQSREARARSQPGAAAKHSRDV